MKSASPCARLAESTAARDGGAFFQIRVGTPRIGTSDISRISQGAVSVACTSAIVRDLEAVVIAALIAGVPARRKQPGRFFAKMAIRHPAGGCRLLPSAHLRSAILRLFANWSLARVLL